jgi:hypothetical protein
VGFGASLEFKMSAQTAIAFFVGTLLKEYIKEQCPLLDVKVSYSGPSLKDQTIFGEFSFDIVDFKRELDVSVVFQTRQKITYDLHMFAWRNDLPAIARKIKNFGRRAENKKTKVKWKIFPREQADLGLALLHIELNNLESLNVEFCGPIAELELFSPHFASQS